MYFLDISKLLKEFFKTLYEVTASTKISLLKLGIRKDVDVTVNKESMNNSSSKNVFLRLTFFTLLQLLVAA